MGGLNGYSLFSLFVGLRIQTSCYCFTGVVVAKRNAKYISASRGHLAMSPASPKLSFKTNRDRSVSSLLSIGVNHRTPKVARRVTGSDEKTVTIRCQRLNADKRYEEVDVEVPGKVH